MPKELYLYTPIYDFTAQELISEMENNMNDEIIIRVNSPGGSVFANYGICAKAIEHGNIKVKVDGSAMSSAANFLLYVNYSEALDVSTFLLHRAEMFVENESDKDFLNKVNKDLRSKMLKKIDGVKFKEISGVSIDELFDSEKRIDVVLTAKQAKDIGLINKVITLTPSQQIEAFENKFFKIAASAEKININNKPKKIIMTIESLKAEHPALFAQVVALGVEQEKDRVEACMAFIEIDAIGVKEAIASGKNLTQKQMAEFSLKALAPKEINAIAEASATTIITDKLELPKSAEAKKTEATMAEVLKLVKIN